MSVDHISHLKPTRFEEEASAAAEAEAVPDEAAVPSETKYLAGEVIADRYRLIRELGRGGMGVVWEARSLSLEVNVAIKLMRGRGTEAERASRMAREAQAAARLAHPALVRVFDFGWTSRGNPFLVMELAKGETLAQALLRDERMEPIRAVQMLLPVADGLRYAHEKGIVHRDIKPDNLFIAVDAFGRLQPKLLDFGIAHVRQPDVDHRLTQVGVVMGSPGYMSPEQARGDEDIDERSDVWSMCVMLYEMISLDMPFQHSNYNALLQAILHQEAKPSPELAAADSGLWQIIQRGLAKSREERWPNMTALGAALAGWLYQHGVKEDLCGNSVRALWLEGQTLPVIPDPPPRSAPSNPSVPPLAFPTEAHVPTPTDEAVVFARNPRPWLTGVALLAVAALLLVLFFGNHEADRTAPAAPDLRAVAAAPSVAPTLVDPKSVAAARADATANEREPAPTRAEADAQARSATPRRAGRADAAGRKKTIRDFGF